MGEKLSEKQNQENIDAIMDFSKGEYRIQVNIRVMEGGRIVESFKDVTIYAGDKLIYMDISIPWEDFYTPQYKNRGLFGIYSTGYNIFDYSQEGDFLKISSNDSNKVIILSKI